jgi:hypothetical protein
MKTLLSLYEDYLRRVGGLEPVTLGGNRRTMASAAETEALIGRLAAASRSNRALGATVTVLHVLVFVVGMALTWHYHQSPKILAATVTGTMVAFIGVTVRLQSFWREKATMDVLVSVLPTLTADEAVKAIQSLYFSQKQTRGGRRSAPRGKSASESAN